MYLLYSIISAENVNTVETIPLNVYLNLFQSNIKAIPYYARALNLCVLNHLAVTTMPALFMLFHF